MNLRTTLMLLALLAGLGFLVRGQFVREAREADLVDQRLFEGVDVGEVVELRIDQIYRSYNLRLQRDAAGLWYLTDPIAYPADSGFMNLLLEDIESARMMPVPETEADAEALGFDPPRVVLDVVTRGAEGEHIHRLEVGAPDLDGRRVNLRRDGRYYRGLRRLYTTLDHEVNEYRSRRALHVPERGIVEVHRTGAWQDGLEGEPEDLTLSAFLEGGTWRSVVPRAAQLDPRDVGVLVFGAARLEISRFIEDEARDLSRYGLEDPVARISLGLSDGTAESLLVSRRGGERGWYATREGSPYVWSIEEQDIVRLFYPFAALVDTHFMTARRTEVQALELEAGGRTLRLEREESSEGWSLRRRSGQEAWSAPARADTDRVDDVLGELEVLELTDFDLGEEARLEAPVEGTLRVTVETTRGRFGGRLGARIEDSPDSAWTFQREGDEVTATVPAWLAELARREAASFLSLDVWVEEEIQLEALELEGSGGAARFVRDGRGLWHRAGEDEEALELLPLLDSLLFLKAAEHAEPPGPPSEVLEVRFIDHAGAERGYRVGLAGEATWLEVGGSWSRARVPDLHGRLAALLEG